MVTAEQITIGIVDQKKVRGLEMAADKEIHLVAAEIVSVQEGGHYRDWDQEDLDSEDDPKSAVLLLQ